MLLPSGTLTTLEIVERLASLNATVDECAVFFGCSQPTVNQRFRAYPALRQAWDRGRGVLG